MQRLGATRSSNQRDHLLQTPDTFVRTSLPCLRGGAAIVHVGPAGGANFTQYTVEMERGAELTQSGFERFLYVISGDLMLQANGKEEQLGPGGFAFVPASVTHVFRASGSLRAVVIERRYCELSAGAKSIPEIVTGHEEEKPAAPLMDDEDVSVRCLLPAGVGFDFAVNTMTYQPGAALSMVEVHVMEHGLLMLEGGGIYRLGDAWYPVQTGDFIWMAPFCPQWFGAIGKGPAKYLIYKDVNRHPLERG